MTIENPERLLTPGEVALMFRVDPKTVTRWASAGRIGSIRTPGGHRRFRESEVTDLLADLTVESAVHRLNQAPGPDPLHNRRSTGPDHRHRAASPQSPTP